MPLTSRFLHGPMHDSFSPQFHPPSSGVLFDFADCLVKGTTRVFETQIFDIEMQQRDDQLYLFSDSKCTYFAMKD